MAKMRRGGNKVTIKKLGAGLGRMPLGNRVAAPMGGAISRPVARVTPPPGFQGGPGFVTGPVRPVAPVNPGLGRPMAPLGRPMGPVAGPIAGAGMLPQPPVGGFGGFRRGPRRF